MKNARLAEHFILLRNEFNKFNNTGAHVLESIYRVSHDNKITQKLYFGCQKVNFLERSFFFLDYKWQNLHSK